MHSMLGTKHLLILALSAAVMVLGILAVRKWPLEKLAKHLLLVGILSEFIKVVYYILANEATHGGVLPKTDLPFHLCSIQIIFVAIVSYTENLKMRELLVSFMIPSCLFGGLAALMIPTTSALNGGWILTVQYFGYHVAIVIFSVTLLLSKEIKLTVKNYFNCLKFLLGLMLFAVYINSILYDGNTQTNFMYVVSPPQAGLPFLNEKHGWLVYMAHYSCLIVFCVTLCYLRPIVRAIRSRKKKTLV